MKDEVRHKTLLPSYFYLLPLFSPAVRALKTTVCAHISTMREIDHVQGTGKPGKCQRNYLEGVVPSREVTAMNIIYTSDNYYVVEYPAQHGYELVDKRSQRGTFFQGDVADRFAKSLQDAVAVEPSVEQVDEFLGSFEVLLNQPLAVH